MTSFRSCKIPIFAPAIGGGLAGLVRKLESSTCGVEMLGCEIVAGFLAPAWLTVTSASAPACESGWQSAVAETMISWAAGSARKPWQWRVPFVLGSP
jgi:hypothetical protein